jgi:hypothetical protein
MRDLTMTFSRLDWRSWVRAALACVIVAATGAALADTGSAQRHPPAQRTFATPEEASQALVAAVRSADLRTVAQVLGPGSSRLIRSGDPVADRDARQRFVAAVDQRSNVEHEGASKATLLIGANDWPFPFPIVKRDGGWRFDVKSGADEVLNRRIGRNELAAIQVCLAYVDAQREYAMQSGDGHGLHPYAMKLVSTRGKKDGLYWRTADGEPPSPLGPLASKAKAEGYTTQPYHGYYYRVLERLGPSATGGAYDYVVQGKMIGGFALVAYPARWGASGVMTLIVNHEGIVYQKNLGRRTAAIAASMTRFDPDSSWSKVQQ